MKKLTSTGATRAGLLVMLFFSSAIFAIQNPTNVSIQGRVVNHPHGVFPSTTITAKNPNSGETLGSTQTDPEGYYQLDLSTVSSEELAFYYQLNIAYPNPFSDKINLEFTPQATGKYTLNVTDLAGRTIMTRQQELTNQETTTFEVSGLGTPGTYIATITGTQERETYKIIQTTSNDQRNVNITTNINTKTQQAINTNNILLEYLGEGHNHKDTTLTWNNHNNVNVVLQVTPKQVQTPYTILVNNTLGNVIPGAEINVYPNEETQTIIQGNTNQEGILNAIFEQTQWIYQTDTIQKINQLRTNADAAQHEPKQVISPYANPMNLEITLTHAPYQYTVPINLESTNPDKTPLSFRAYVLQEGDTLAVQNFTGTQGTLNFEGATSNMNVVVGAINIPHFDETQKNATLTTGENAQTLNTNPIIYSYNVSGNVLFENENPAQANVSAEDQNTNTNAQGTYSLVDIIRQTNTNNAPLTYNTEVTATGDFETQTKNILVDGANKTVNFTIPNPLMQYALIINLESNNPDKTPLSFRGYVLQAGDTLAVQNFQGTQGTLNFESTTSNMNVVVGARNIPHFGPTQKNKTMNPGENQETLNTNPIVYSYNVTGNVLYENNNPVQANVAAEGQNTNTNAQGAYSLLDIIRNTNTNNAPLTYTAIVSATGDFETQNKNITVDGQNKTVNFEVPNPPPPTQNVNFTFKPLTVNGTIPDQNIIYFIKFGNQTHQYTLANMNANNEIEVNITAETTSNTITTWTNSPVTAEPDIDKYSDLVIIHTQNREPFDPPLDNNNMMRNRRYNHQPFDTLRVEKNLIHNRHDLEILVVDKYFEHAVHGRLYLSEAPLSRIISRKTAGRLYAHFPEGLNAQPWNIEILTNDMINGNPVTQTYIDNWTAGTLANLNRTIREDGQKTFDWNNITYIDNPIHDPNNGGYNAYDIPNHTLRIVPRSDVSMATNSTIVDLQEGIIKGYVSNPTGETQLIIIREEGIEAKNAYRNPGSPHPGGSTSYTVSNGDEYILTTITRMRNQVKHGTRMNYTEGELE